MNTERQPSTQTLSITTIEFTDAAKAGGAPVDPNVGVVAGLKIGEEMEATKETPVVIPESFFEALKREKPDGINWDKVDLAVAVLKGEKDAVIPKPPEPEPTDSQKFWRKMFETENSPYGKENRPMKWDAAKNALDELTHDLPSFMEHFPQHISAIDVDFRGGRDPGDVKERLQRVATMSGMIALFMAFDVVSSYPMKKIIKHFLPLRNDDSWHDAVIWGFGKFTEVANDKLATAWGDDLVSYATGKKTGFTTEPTDKLADVGNVAFEDKMEDYVNGPVLEGAARILYQIQ